MAHDGDPLRCRDVWRDVEELFTCADFANERLNVPNHVTIEGIRFVPDIQIVFNGPILGNPVAVRLAYSFERVLIASYVAKLYWKVEM